MTDARVSQLAVEVLRTNLDPDAQISQLAVEVLRPNAARGLTAAAGGFTLSGQIAALTRKRAIAGAAGAFVLSGQGAGSLRAYAAHAIVGAFILTGGDAALKLPGKMICAAGDFAISGQPAVIGRKLKILTAVGTFVLAGQVADDKYPYRKIGGNLAAFGFSGKNAALAYPRNIIDPVTGLTILRRLRVNAPAYADADAAYNAWAALLGVNSTGTDYVVSSGPEGVDFVPLALPILDGSTYAGLHIPHSGAIGMYMSPPTTTTGASTPYNWSVVDLGRLTLAVDRPVFVLRAFNTGVSFTQYQNTNLKLRRAFNPMTGAYETIVIMTSASPTSPQYPIRCAYRMAAGYLEAIFTVNPVDLPAGGYFFIGYIIANESTDIAVGGDTIFSSSTAGTFGIISDDYSALRPYMVETATTADAVLSKKNVYASALDTQSLRDAIQALWSITMAQTVASTDAATYAFHPGALINEVVALADAQPRKWNFPKTISESTRLAEALVVAFPVLLVDTPTLASAASAVRAVLVLEQLRMLDPATTVGDFYVQLVETLVANDALRRFLGGGLTDSVGVSGVTTYAPILGKVLTDSVTVTDTLANKLILRVTAPDGVNLDDDAPPHWVFKPVLTDGVEIAIGFLQPSGAFTTWAVNTRTGAVTEYQNFEFNSFAQVGHKYIGTSDSGLYELNGDDDDGTDIIAQIRSGYAQFGGSKYSSFKAAYIGMRGNGDIILKLDTGDGKTYTYQTVVQDMQSTKVRLGKGLRARYFAFELISTGPDFDLDTIEFIPLVAQRRV